MKLHRNDKGSKGVNHWDCPLPQTYAVQKALLHIPCCVTLGTGYYAESILSHDFVLFNPRL